MGRKQEGFDFRIDKTGPLAPLSLASTVVGSSRKYPFDYQMIRGISRTSPDCFSTRCTVPGTLSAVGKALMGQLRAIHGISRSSVFAAIRCSPHKKKPIMCLSTTVCCQQVQYCTVCTSTSTYRYYSEICVLRYVPILPGFFSSSI